MLIYIMIWFKVPRSKCINVEDIDDTKNEKMYKASNLSSTQLDTVSKISQTKCLVEAEFLVQAHRNPKFTIWTKFAPVFVGHVHRQPKPSKIRFGFSWFLYFIVITFLIWCSTSIKLVIMSSLAWQALETPPEVLCAWRTTDVCKVNSRIILSWR